MISFVLLITILIIIILILKNRTKNINNKSNIYKNLIYILLIFGIIFIVATSGRIVLPQILQLLKIGIPLITKFIGIW